MDPHNTLLATAFLVSVGAYASGHLLRRSWRHAVFGMLATPLVLLPLGIAAGTCAVALLKGAAVASSTINAVGLGTTIFTVFGLFGLFLSQEFAERNHRSVPFAPKVLTRPRRWRKLPIRVPAKAISRPHHDTPHSRFRKKPRISPPKTEPTPVVRRHQVLRESSSSHHAYSFRG